MPEKTETIGKTRPSFEIPNYLAKRIEADAQFKGQNATKWWHEAALHFLECSKSRKEFVRNLRYELIISPLETECSKCAKKILPDTAILYNSSGRILCPECYSERFGNKALVTMTLNEVEAKKRLNVLDADIKEKAEEASTWRDKDKLHEIVSLLHDCTVRRESNEKMEDSYFKAKVGQPDEKATFDLLRKGADALSQEVEKIKPLIADLEISSETRMGIAHKLKRRKRPFEQDIEEQA